MALRRAVTLTDMKTLDKGDSGTMTLTKYRPMTTPLLICDDSLVARKQMRRALPADWDVLVTFAQDGKQCLEQLRAGAGDILFLDLNMPVMDGYEVLQAIRDEDLSTLVVVVSGDIQPEAQKRVRRLGAITLMRKPVAAEDLQALLADFGLYSPTPGGACELGSTIEPEAEWTDILQEQANIAMGQAGDRLARLLGVFVELAVPRVNTLAASELHMALSVGSTHTKWSGVCQGFVGGGLAGEALLLFSDSSIEDMSTLLGYTVNETEHRDIEVLMDLSGILAGAFLGGLGQQLDLSPRLSHPVVLGTHVQMDDLLQANKNRWEQLLTIELSFAVEGHDIVGNLLLLLTEDSIPRLRQTLDYLQEAS